MLRIAAEIFLERSKVNTGRELEPKALFTALVFAINAWLRKLEMVYHTVSLSRECPAGRVSTSISISIYMNPNSCIHSMEKNLCSTVL